MDHRAHTGGPHHDDPHARHDLVRVVGLMPTPNNQIRRKGSFAPLYANVYDDDAIVEAGEPAELLFYRGLAYCARILSDGVITDNQLSRGPGVGMSDPKDRAETLVRVGLWERLDNGYRVRSWLQWNSSRDEIEVALEADRARKRRPRGGGSPPPPPPPDPGGPQYDDADPAEDFVSDQEEDPAPASTRIPGGIPPDAGRTPHVARSDSDRSPLHTYTYNTHTDTHIGVSASRAGAHEGTHTREATPPDGPPRDGPPRDDRPRPVNRPIRGPRRQGGAAGVAARYGSGVQADTYRVVQAAVTRHGVGDLLPNETFRALCTAVEHLVAGNRSAGYTDEQLIAACVRLLEKGLHPNALSSVMAEVLTKRPDLRPVRVRAEAPARSTAAAESVDAAFAELHRRRTGGS